MPAPSSSLIDRVHCQSGGSPRAIELGLTGQECLLRALSRVPDPRDARGVRHQMPAVMAMSIAAVLAGSRSFYAIGQWIAGAKQNTLKALGARRDPDSGRYVGPDEKTVRRLCATVDGDALDGALGNWLARRRHLALAARARRGRTHRKAGSGGSRRQKAAGQRRPRKSSRDAHVPAMPAVAVDGKTVRGARTAQASAPHLLAALIHGGVVLAQRQIADKSNEVRHEAPCRIPGTAGMNSEGGSWARRLTWIRKVKGTRACRDSDRSCPDAWNDAVASPRDMAKAELPESQSPAMQVFIHRKWRLRPVPRPAPVYLVGGSIFRDVGRCPVRVFKGMSGAPKSRYDVRQGRTWDRLRDASPRATECPQ